MFGIRKIKIPKTAQQTLPWEEVYENGIIKVKDDLYCMICSFTNINYKFQKEEEQQKIFKRYCEALSSLDPGLLYQIYLTNKNIDENQVIDALLPQKNNYEELQEEYNDVIRHFVHESSNKTAERKSYIAIGVVEKKMKNVIAALDKAYREVAARFKVMKSEVKKVQVEDELKIFFEFYNFQNDFFTLPADIYSRGVNIKDYIAPSSFSFKHTYTEMGTAYSRTMFVRDFPTSLSDEFIADLLDNPFNLSVSIHIKPENPGDAVTFLKRKLTSLETNKYDYNKKNAREGTNYLPYELRNSIKEAEKMLDNLTKKNKRMFKAAVYINVLAENLEDLDDRTKTIQGICRKHIVLADTLSHQQEEGIASTLPLCNNKAGIKRTLLTDSAAILMPFSNQDIFMKNGFYYGRNSISSSLIVLDRRQLQNSSGFMLGIPGSGKSFKSKREIADVLLNTNDDVIVIDPEREYATMCNKFSGEDIRISASSKNNINPFDLNADYADDDGDPIPLKSEFIMSMIETLVGKLTPAEKTITDRCVKLSYAKFLEYNYDQQYIPDFKTFFAILKNQQEEEAAKLALKLELYVEGSLNTFSNKSNITLKNRFTVFDTKDLGKQLKKLGILITLDCVWNRVCINRYNGKKTWIYTDEFYLLFDDGVKGEESYSANYYFELYKRARKWGGIPTGITQNISDLLKSDKANTMLSNSQFVVLMNQSATDRSKIAEALGLGEIQLAYVTDALPGNGLIICEGNVIPFKDEFPKDTKLYKMMTTKVDELQKAI